MMHRALPLLLLAALWFAGCGETVKTGGIGDRLDGEQVQVKLLALRRDVPAESDYRVLGSPGPDERIVAADIGLCNQSGQAVIAWHFELETDDGARLHPRFPQGILRPQLDSLREGCEHGWVVFAIPRQAKPAKLHYAFDDSGESYRSGRRTTHTGSEHDRFSWTL